MSDTCMNHIEGYWQRLTASANDFFYKRTSVAPLDFSGKTAEGLEKRKKVLVDLCSTDVLA